MGQRFQFKGRIKIKKEILIWTVLIAAAVADNAAYTVKNYLSFIDLIFICSSMLVLNGRVLSGFFYMLAAYSIKDAFLLPELGYNLVPGLAALVLVKILSVALYRENYTTKVFALAVSFLLKLVIGLIVVYIFYWSRKVFFFPSRMFYVWLFTVVSGAVIIKVVDFDYGKGASWLNTMFRRT